MNAELELAQQKIHDLELKLRALMGRDEQLQLLPNGDLHRGIKLENFAEPNIEAEVLPASFGNPLNRIVADVLKAAKGGHALTCLHCGIQYDGMGSEKDIREHYKKDHPSVVEGHDKIVPELLMANLEEAKQRLAAAGA